VHTAAYLAKDLLYKVLLVDLDTQGHAGKSLGIDVRSLKRTVFDFLVDPAVGFAEVMRPSAVAGLHVLPSNKTLADFATRVATDPERDLRLQRKLAPLKGYDFMIFDSPPSLGAMTANILLAAEEIVIPVGLTYFALDGCAEILDSVRRVSETGNRPELRVTRVVPTLYRKTALADAILEKLRSRFPDTIASTVLGFNVEIDEAQSHGQTIWEYAPSSRGARMLAAIAADIANAAREGVGAAETARPAVM
jgi:chromosome partitioning protein